MPASDYLVSIGLEVHVQLKTQSKMFCACPVRFGAPPNTLICPTCLGLPGSLPKLNAGAIEMTVLAGQLLGCTTPEIVKWDRKNYFYADMPKNYQLSQYDLPLCLGGEVPLYELAYPKDAQKSIVHPDKVVNLTRIHLEEDVAKSTHHASYTLIDFNRSGTALMEIVSEPELESAEETVAYLNSLRQILVYSGVSDADMEKGQLRCDVNVSVRPKGQEKLGTKIELKNLNSVSAVRRALHYEIDRQVREVEAGRSIQQATWRWNDEIGQTEPMRSKEDAHDYRYFPEPDLLPVRTAPFVERTRAIRPELPHEKVDRFEKSYQVSHYDASVLAADRSLADWFEQAAQGTSAPKKVANWAINNLLAELNVRSIDISLCPISPRTLTDLVELIESGKVSNNQGKEIFTLLFDRPAESPAALAKELGFEPADSSEIETFVDEVIAANPDPVAEVTGGNEKAANFLVGQVMKRSKGKANPKQVTEILLARLRPS